MDYQWFADSVAVPCCVMSVQKTSAGTCGEIRIVCANQSYRDTMGPAYYDNMLYHELVPKDDKFEDYCFRSAIGRQRMHAYVQTVAFDCWTDQTMIPLESDREDLGYCQFIFEFTRTAEVERLVDASFNVAGELSKVCLRLMSNQDFQSALGAVLEDILLASEAMGCRLQLVDHERKETGMLCERSALGAWPDRPTDQDVITYELVQTWEDVVGQSNEIIIKDEAGMEALARINPLWAKSMRDSGVRSLVFLPLRGESVSVGYLYVVNFNVEKVVEVKQLLEPVAFILGSEINRQLLMKKLRFLSTLDELTGLNNRRSMFSRIQTIDRMENRQPYGVVNLDLNGLKRVNDSEGHEAGDSLLIQAAQILRSAFPEEDVFRTGGDEFVVISVGISQADFERRMDLFRSELSRHENISFAVGACWTSGADDTTTVMRLADERMYEDKKAYYARNPQLRR